MIRSVGQRENIMETAQLCPSSVRFYASCDFAETVGEPFDMRGFRTYSEKANWQNICRTTDT